MSRTIALLLALMACETPPAAAPAAPASTPAPAASGGAPAAAAQDGVADPVASIGGAPISLAEIDKAAAAGLIKAKNDMYEARRQALEQMIGDRLLEAEAKARGTTKEELLKAEVDGKVPAVTDADIEAFYQQNQQRMRGGSLDQMKDQIRGYLDQQRKQGRAMEFVGELRAKNSVVVNLEPPRIPVQAGDSPRYGSAEAPVQIIEFSDFQCPYCTRGAETMKQVKEKYGDKVSIVYRHFPLDFHDRANAAAQASECANDQGKFWQFHDQLFANQRALTDQDFEKYSAAAEMDLAKFRECLASGKHAETVATDLKEGAEAGMTGTPGFFINGRFLGGAQPIEAFSEIIDAELAKKG